MFGFMGPSVFHKYYRFWCLISDLCNILFTNVGLQILAFSDQNVVQCWVSSIRLQQIPETCSQSGSICLEDVYIIGRYNNWKSKFIIFLLNLFIHSTLQKRVLIRSRGGVSALVKENLNSSHFQRTTMRKLPMLLGLGCVIS